MGATKMPAVSEGGEVKYSVSFAGRLYIYGAVSSISSSISKLAASQPACSLV